MKRPLLLIAWLVSLSLACMAQYTHKGIFTNGGGAQTSGAYSTQSVLGEELATKNNTNGSYTNSSGYLFTNLTTAIYGTGEISGCNIITIEQETEFSASGWTNAESYVWESGSNGVAINPIGNGSSATVIVTNPSLNEIIITVTPENQYTTGTPVSRTISVDNQPVWPGDFNNDGELNINDMSYLVTSYSQYLLQHQGVPPTIPIRNTECSGLNFYDWAAQAAENSNILMPNVGVDFKFADAHPNGIVEHDASTYYPQFGTLPVKDGEVFKYQLYTKGSGTTHPLYTKQAPCPKLDNVEITIEELNYPEEPQFIIRVSNNSGKGLVKGITGRITLDGATATSYFTNYSGSIMGIQSYDMQICDLLYQDNQTFDFTINRTDGMAVEVGENEELYQISFDFEEAKSEAVIKISDIFVMGDDNVLYQTVAVDSVIITGNFITGNNAATSRELQIFPNPVGEFISISGIELSEIVFVEIFNLQGISCKKLVQPKSATINVSDLSKGSFFIKVTTTNRTFINKFIKI